LLINIAIADRVLLANRSTEFAVTTQHVQYHVYPTWNRVSRHPSAERACRATKKFVLICFFLYSSDHLIQLALLLLLHFEIPLFRVVPKTIRSRRMRSLKTNRKRDNCHETITCIEHARILRVSNESRTRHRLLGDFSVKKKKSLKSNLNIPPMGTEPAAAERALVVHSRFQNNSYKIFFFQLLYCIDSSSFPAGLTEPFSTREGPPFGRISQRFRGAELTQNIIFTGKYNFTDILSRTISTAVYRFSIVIIVIKCKRLCVGTCVRKFFLYTRTNKS